MKSLLTSVILILSFLEAAAFAQQATSTVQHLEANAHLVTVPTAVTLHGQPLRGLKAGDFSIFNNGKPEQIAFVEEIDAVANGTMPQTLPPQTVRNVVDSTAEQDTTILLLDFLNGDRWSSADIKRYLSDIAHELNDSNTKMTVLVLSYKGLVEVHSFTADPGALFGAIDKWKSNAGGRRDILPDPIWRTPAAPTDERSALDALEEFAVLPSQAPKGPDFIPVDRLNTSAMTRRALEQIAEAFGGIRGRKKLIWLTAKVPDLIMAIAGGRPGRAGYLDRLWQTLGDNNFIVYPIIRNHLEVGSPSGGHYTASYSGWCQGDPPTMALAERTGGHICDDAPPVCIKRIREDASHYYILGFYIPPNERTGWHELKVKVSRKSAVISSRTGFWVDGNSRPEPMRDDSRSDFSGPEGITSSALGSPLDYTGIPITLQWSFGKKLSKGTSVTFVVEPNIEITAQQSRDIQAMGVIWAHGDTKPRLIQLEDDARSRSRYIAQIDLPMGTYDVRFLVHDLKTDKVGTVSAQIITPADLNSERSPQ